MAVSVTTLKITACALGRAEELDAMEVLVYELELDEITVFGCGIREHSIALSMSWSERESQCLCTH